jgi:hypothetical protein
MPRERKRFIGALLICWKVTTGNNNRPELKRLKGMRRYGKQKEIRWDDFCMQIETDRQLPAKENGRAQ